MALSFGVLAVVGTAIAFADRSLEVPGDVARPVNAIAAALAAAAAIAGVVLAARRRGSDRLGRRPLGGLQVRLRRDRVRRLAIQRRPGQQPLRLLAGRGRGAVRGGAADRHRLRQLRGHLPAEPRERRGAPLSPQPADPGPRRHRHHRGALLLGFAIAAIVAAARTRARAENRLGRGVAGMAIAAAAYFALHSAGDWLWTFTAITAPVFAWLAIAGRSRRLRIAGPRRGVARRGRSAGRGAAARRCARSRAGGRIASSCPGSPPATSSSRPPAGAPTRRRPSSAWTAPAASTSSPPRGPRRRARSRSSRAIGQRRSAGLHRGTRARAGELVRAAATGRDRLCIGEPAGRAMRSWSRPRASIPPTRWSPQRCAACAGSALSAGADRPELLGRVCARGGQDGRDPLLRIDDHDSGRTC